MALVNCPECNTAVSSKASACPSCANPMNQSGLRAGRLDPVVAIEKTGKGLKLQRLLAFTLLFAGVVVGCVGFNVQPLNQSLVTKGSVMFSAALGWLLIVRWKTWWRHG